MLNENLTHEIRIVPEWNVNQNRERVYTIGHLIRIVPEWNVNMKQ